MNPDEFLTKAIDIGKSIMEKEGAHPPMLFILPKETLIGKQFPEIVPISVPEDYGDGKNDKSIIIRRTIENTKAEAIVFVTEIVSTTDGESLLIGLYDRGGNVKGHLINFERTSKTIKFSDTIELSKSSHLSQVLVNLLHVINIRKIA